MDWSEKKWLNSNENMDSHFAVLKKYKLSSCLNRFR